MAFVTFVIREDHMAMLGVVHSALSWGGLPLRGTTLRHRTVVGHMTDLSTSQACWWSPGSGSTSLRIGLFSTAPWRVLDSVGATFTLALLGFALTTTSWRHWRARGVRRSSTRGKVAISQCDNRQIAATELDLVEPLPGIKVRSVRTVELLRLLVRVGVLQGLVVGRICVEILMGFVSIAVGQGRVGLVVVIFIVSFFPTTIIRPLIVFGSIVFSLIVGRIGASFATKTSMVLLMLSTSHSFVVLSKDQEHRFLHLLALHRWSLGRHKLFLLL